MNYLDAIGKFYRRVPEIAESAAAVLLISYQGDVLSKTPVSFMKLDDGSYRVAELSCIIERAGRVQYMILVDAQGALLHVFPVGRDLKIGETDVMDGYTITFVDGIALQPELPI